MNLGTTGTGVDTKDWAILQVAALRGSHDVENFWRLMNRLCGGYIA